MFTYTLDYAVKSRLFTEIIVSTESEEVRRICSRYGHEIPFMRPPELATDQAQLVDVCRHVLEEYERRGRTFTNFCLLWATAPMRTDRDMRAAFELLDGETDAVVGVTDFDLPPLCAMEWGADRLLTPLFPEYMKLPGSKHPRVVVDNGTMCWVNVEAFRKHQTWLPPRLKGFWIPRRFSVDIETEEDWKLAEFYYRKYFLTEKDQSGP
jgi:CMP-N-acetylneuraminic acid synthetase